MEIVGYSLEEMTAALERMEGILHVGQKARLQLCLDALPSRSEVDNFFLDARNAGHHLDRPEVGIIDGIAVVDIVIQKGSPALMLLIPLIPTILTIGLIAFGVTQIETVSKAIMPILLTALGGTIILIGVLRNPAERVATKYVESRR